MAWGNFVLDVGFTPSAATIKFRCVKMTAAETVGPVTANTDDIVGVDQFGVSAADMARGKDSSVRLIGVSEVEAAGAIPVNAWCQLEADGRVSARVGASGKKLVGKCVGNPAANAGDRIAMLVVHTFSVA